MTINGIILLRDVIDKLAFKHRVEQEEVEEVFENRPKFRFLEKGERAGEDILGARPKQCGTLFGVMFIHKKSNDALILSARTMAPKERKLYGKK